MSGEETAQSLLLKKQSSFPAPAANKGDRVQALVEALRPSLPAGLAALIGSDTLAIGELGEVHPDVATWPIGDRYVITFSTGMFVYLDTIVPVLSARFVEGADGQMALEFKRAADLLREAMKTYRKQTNLLWSLFKPQFPSADFPVSPAVTKFREDLIGLTSRFLLAHELGHVAIGTKIRPRTADLEETDADRFGLEFSLRAAYGESQGLALAAAALAIRLYVSLERFGSRFTDDYPKMDERLRTLDDALLPLLGCAQRRDELSRIMVATLDLMDALDNAIDPSLPPIPITTGRLRVGIIARLYELARGGLSTETFDDALQDLAQSVPASQFTDALTQVCEYYWFWADTVGAYIRDLAQYTTYTHEWAIANSRALRAAIPRLPEAQRAALPEKYRGASA